MIKHPLGRQSVTQLHETGAELAIAERVKGADGFAVHGKSAGSAEDHADEGPHVPWQLQVSKSQPLFTVFCCPHRLSDHLVEQVGCFAPGHMGKVIAAVAEMAKTFKKPGDTLFQLNCCFWILVLHICGMQLFQFFQAGLRIILPGCHLVAVKLQETGVISIFFH